MIRDELKHIFHAIINEEFHPSCLKGHSSENDQMSEANSSMAQKIEMLNLELKMLQDSLEEQKKKYILLNENNILMKKKITLMEEADRAKYTLPLYTNTGKTKTPKPQTETRFTSNNATSISKEVIQEAVSKAIDRSEIFKDTYQSWYSTKKCSLKPTTKVNS